MPTAPPPSRREEAALEETVEHVHDFDVPAVPVAAAPPAVEEPVAAAAPPAPVVQAPPAPPPARPEIVPAARPEPPYEPPASRFIQPMPEGRRDSTSVAMPRRTSP